MSARFFTEGGRPGTASNFRIAKAGSDTEEMEKN
jgi:hypothetical protein